MSLNPVIASPASLYVKTTLRMVASRSSFIVLR